MCLIYARSIEVHHNRICHTYRYSKYVIMHMNRVENLWGIVSQKIRIAKETCRKEAHAVVVAQ